MFCIQGMVRFYALFRIKPLRSTAVSTRQLIPLSFILADVLPRQNVVVLTRILKERLFVQTIHSSLTAQATRVSNPFRYIALPQTSVSFHLGLCLRCGHSHSYSSILPVLEWFSNPLMNSSKSFLKKHFHIGKKSF